MTDTTRKVLGYTFESMDELAREDFAGADPGTLIYADDNILFVADAGRQDRSD